MLALVRAYHSPARGLCQGFSFGTCCSGILRQVGVLIYSIWEEWQGMLCVPMDAAYVFFGELALMDYCILSTPSDTQLPHPDHSGVDYEQFDPATGSPSSS